MSPEFKDALTDASALLRQLPRGRPDVAEARSQFAEFQATHPALVAALVVEQPPGAVRLDYDLLLTHPDGGTLAMAWRDDTGSPWCVDQTEHWATNFVVTVNGAHVTVQEAFLSLKLASNRFPDLLAELVDQHLIAEAIENDPPPVSEAELQAEADLVRSANNLHSADATMRWLEQMGITIARFQTFLVFGVQVRKLKDRLTLDQAAAYFDAHTSEFDVVQLLEMSNRSEDEVRQTAGAARHQGLWAAAGPRLTGAHGAGWHGGVRLRYARDLSSSLAAVAPGTIIGPTPVGPDFRLVEILGRRPASFDHATRSAIRDLLFDEWLVGRRRHAVVRWHWM